MTEDAGEHGDASKADFNAHVKHFADILNPLFWDDQFNEVHRMFEWVCTLVRAGGLQDSGWDSYTESIALLGDLSNLMRLKLDADSRFPDWEATELRLALLAYSHMVEMDFPYDLLVNLLRLRSGELYCMRPFAHLGKKVTKKSNGVKYIVNVIKASPATKMAEIRRRAEKCGMPQIADAVESVYECHPKCGITLRFRYSQWKHALVIK